MQGFPYSSLVYTLPSLMNYPPSWQNGPMTGKEKRQQVVINYLGSRKEYIDDSLSLAGIVPRDECLSEIERQ